MAFDSSKSVYGRFIGPKKDRSIESVVLFLEKQLPQFSKEYSKSRIKNEEGLSQKLFFLLERNSRDYPFFFAREYIAVPENGKSPRVDFGVIARTDKGIIIATKFYNYDEAFFHIEAKRLPTPGGKQRNGNM